MKLKILTFILLSALLLSNPVLGKKKSRVIRPINASKKITTLISGKKRAYYYLDKQTPTVLSVKGPGVLRVITRARFKPGSGQTADYEVLYSVDGSKQQKIKIKGVKRSRKSTYLKGALGVPGTLQDFSIKLTRGYHTILVQLNDSKYPLAARYLFHPLRLKKQRWIPFTPVAPTDPVELVVKEETTTYYRFSAEKPLQVEIIGPTLLRVFTRVENHYDMKGRIHYRLQVKEGNKIIRTYRLSSWRSEVAAYHESSTLVPGKAREVVLEIPKGKHQYNILPLDKDKSTLLGKLLFPEKDTKLSE